MKPMNGKQFIETNGLEPGEYNGYEGAVEFTAEDLAELAQVEFSPEELERIAAESHRDLPRVDLISDEFIAEAAKLGDVDLEVIRKDMADDVAETLMEVADDSHIIDRA